MSGPMIILPAIRRFLSDESGATAIEYAIIAGSIAVVISSLVWNIGSMLRGKFDAASKAFESK